MILTGCCSLLAVKAHSVTDPYALLKKVQQVYTGGRSLRFEMVYRYAYKDTPGEVLDSLRGHVTMQDKNFCIVIGDNESMANQRYMFQVFNQERVICMASRTHNQQTEMALPAFLLDSITMAKSGLKATAETDSMGESLLSLVFPDELLYKKAVFTIDKMGYILGASYEVKAEALLSTEAVTSGKVTKEERDAYGIVTVQYSHFSTVQVNSMLFSDSRFVTEQDGNYIASSSFKGYTIYNTNPKP